MSDVIGILKKNIGETVDAYIDRVCIARKDLGITWEQLAEVINEQCGLTHDESCYRRNFKKKFGKITLGNDEAVATAEPATDDGLDSALYKIRKERMKLSDERVQANADLRTLSRREMLQSIAHDAVQQMSAKKMLPCPSAKPTRTGANKAILQLSDWHYGIEVDNFWNKYNPEIARQRVGVLLEDVMRHCIDNDVSEIHVVNLSDLICGRIHLPLRLQSKIDVITQIMEVSEMVAEFLTELSTTFEVHYYDCLDNHSRLEPIKSDAMDVESLVRIVPWYLSERCANNDRINIHDNTYGDDIISFSIDDYNIVGVHGDKDKPSHVVDNLSLMTHSRFDLVLTAHMHHFSCDEKNEILVVSNGSLMGTDDYAKGLRLSSVPSQNLIIVTEYSVAECIYRICLK